jgi:hypothetical protein
MHPSSMGRVLIGDNESDNGGWGVGEGLGGHLQTLFVSVVSRLGINIIKHDQSAWRHQ